MQSDFLHNAPNLKSAKYLFLVTNKNYRNSKKIKKILALNSTHQERRDEKA